MRQRWVSVRGLRLCLCEWGPPSGPQVLILHGWLDQAAAWDRTARRLGADGWRVMALEHRGHGHSAHAPQGSTYHFTEYIADVDALLRAEADSPIALVGHSMGGTIAAQVAALRPAAVRHLTLIEGLGPPRVSDEDAVTRLRTHLDHLSRPPPVKSVDSVAAGAARIRRLNPALPLDEAMRLASRVLLPAPDGRLQWRWDPMHRTRAAVAFDLDRFLLLLRQVTCPTALLFGKQSWYLQLPDLEERISCIADVQLNTLLDTGHSPHMEAPDLLAETLQAALSGAVR